MSRRPFGVYQGVFDWTERNQWTRVLYPRDAFAGNFRQRGVSIRLCATNAEGRDNGAPVLVSKMAKINIVDRRLPK